MECIDCKKEIREEDAYEGQCRSCSISETKRYSERIKKEKENEALNNCNFVVVK